MYIIYILYIYIYIYIYIFIDVVGLYPNIPHDVAMRKALDEREE